MMQVQNIPIEISLLVFKLLDSQNLLYCALVCKDWTDLALDIKWKENAVELTDLLRGLGSLEEPLNATDAHSCAMRETGGIERTLSSPGWLRVNDLRKKITRLKIVTPLDPDRLTYLAELLYSVESLGSPFCPSLRSLELTGKLQPSHPIYEFIAGNSLRQLVLSLKPQPEAEIETALKTLTSNAPRIKDLAAMIPYTEVGYGMFSELRSLRYGGIPSMLWWSQLCAGCPKLEDLWVCTERVFQTALEQLELAQKVRSQMGLPAPYAFPSLRTLDLVRHQNGSYVKTLFLQSTEMPQLEDLAVNLSRMPLEDGNALIALLSTRSPRLSKILLEIDTLDWKILGAFRHLHDLTITGNPRTFDEEDLISLVKNLPEITRLLIKSTQLYSIRSKPRPTTNLLENIAANCSSIREIQIPLNTTSAPCLGGNQECTPLAGFTRLKTLSLNPLFIEPRSMGPFATYLAQLCPTAESFEPRLMHSDGADEGRYMTWALTPEETSNVIEMQSLFWEAQQGGIELQGASR
ncbi:hypothetical protein FRB90_009278 [Tulasnella sp. 427]|nr:hypothetical protein FRB90_009278 [Tulasnella sp. 427]